MPSIGLIPSISLERVADRAAGWLSRPSLKRFVVSLIDAFDRRNIDYWFSAAERGVDAGYPHCSLFNSAMVHGQERSKAALRFTRVPLPPLMSAGRIEKDFALGLVRWRIADMERAKEDRCPAALAHCIQVRLDLRRAEGVAERRPRCLVQPRYSRLSDFIGFAPSAEDRFRSLSPRSGPILQGSKGSICPVAQFSRQ